MTAPDTERIAREAVALCADLLRRFTPDGPLLTRVTLTQLHVDDMSRQVLAWQEALDDTTPRQ